MGVCMLPRKMVRPAAEPDTCVFETELGWMVLSTHGDAVDALSFGHPSREAALQAARRFSPDRAAAQDDGERMDADWTFDGAADAAPSAEEIADRLGEYARGAEVHFDDVPICQNHLRPFARRVVERCRRLAWGQTSTYGKLAAACGSPKAARAVGQVMAANRIPLIIPCHRVLGAGGRLGGFSAPQGLRMKQRLLEMERAL